MNINNDLFTNLSTKHKKYRDMSNSILKNACRPITTMAQHCSPSQRWAERRKFMESKLTKLQTQYKKNLTMSRIGQSKYQECQSHENKTEITPKRNNLRSSGIQMKQMYKARLNRAKMSSRMSI